MAEKPKAPLVRDFIVGQLKDVGGGFFETEVAVTILSKESLTGQFQVDNKPVGNPKVTTNKMVTETLRLSGVNPTISILLRGDDDKTWHFPLGSINLPQKEKKPWLDIIASKMTDDQFEIIMTPPPPGSSICYLDRGKMGEVKVGPDDLARVQFQLGDNRRRIDFFLKGKPSQRESFELPAKDKSEKTSNDKGPLTERIREAWEKGKKGEKLWPKT